MMRLLTARKTVKQRVRRGTSRALYNSWKRPYRESLCHPNPRGGGHLGKPVFQVREDLTLQKELPHQWETDDQCRCKWGLITPSVPWYISE